MSPESPRWERSAVIGTFLFISVLFYWPLFAHLFWLGGNDWNYFILDRAVSYITAFDYHQFPFWNPYSHGGFLIMGNPQNSALSPSFLFSAIFGIIPGLKFEILFHSVLGMTGMYLLLRHFNASLFSSMAAAVIFMLNSHFVLHVSVGHMTWLPMAYLPFLFLAYLKSLSRTEPFFIAAFLLALMFLEGGTYIVLFTALFLGLYSFLVSCQTRSIKPLAVLFCIFLLFILFSAPKLLPVLEIMSRYPYHLDVKNAIPFEALYSIFLSPVQTMYNYNRISSFPGTGWWEFGCYVGIIPAILFIASFRLFREQWPLLLSAVFFLLLGLGPFASFSPWAIIHSIPPFTSTQGFPRVYFVFVFLLSIMTALCLEHLVSSLKILRSKNRSFPVIILLCVIFDLFYVNAPIVAEGPVPVTFNEAIFKKGNVFRQAITLNDDQLWGAATAYLRLLENQGNVTSYEPLRVKTTARASNDPKYREEYYLAHGQGEVSLAYWSPNKLIFDLKMKGFDTLIINQNFDKNWKSIPKDLVRSSDGLLSVHVTPALKQVTLYYRPVSFIWGMALFFCGLALFLLCRRFSVKIFPEKTTSAMREQCLENK